MGWLSRHCCWTQGAPGQTTTPNTPSRLCLPRACCVTPGQAALSDRPWTLWPPPLLRRRVVNTELLGRPAAGAVCKMAVEYDRFIESGRKCRPLRGAQGACPGEDSWPWPSAA